MNNIASLFGLSKENLTKWIVGALTGLGAAFLAKLSPDLAGSLTIVIASVAGVLATLLCNWLHLSDSPIAKKDGE